MRSFQFVVALVATALLAAELSAQPPGRGKFGGDGDNQNQRGPGGMQRGGQGGRGGPGGGGPGGGGMGGRMVQMMPLFIALDKDQDGALSESEIRNAVAAIKTLDKNKNGKIDADELAPDRSGMGGGPGGGRMGAGGQGGNRMGRGQGPGGPGGGAGPGGGGFRGGRNQGGGEKGATRPKRPSQE